MTSPFRLRVYEAAVLSEAGRPLGKLYYSFAAWWVEFDDMPDKTTDKLGPYTQLPEAQDAAVKYIEAKRGTR